jgi:hypothetical protein
MIKFIVGVVIGFAVTLWVLEHYPIVMTFFHTITKGIL